MKTGSIVGDSKLGVDFTKLKMGVAVETLMRVEFHALGKGEVSFEVGVHARSMDRVIGTFVEGLEEAIDALFFSWGFSWVVVFKLPTDFLK